MINANLIKSSKYNNISEADYQRKWRANRSKDKKQQQRLRYSELHKIHLLKLKENPTAYKQFRQAENQKQKLERVEKQKQLERLKLTDPQRYIEIRISEKVKRDLNKEQRYRQRAYQAKIRKSVIMQHYGNKCICCSENEYLFLEIDHINGGGYKHRKNVTGSGDTLSRWIIKNNFPNVLQILCSNCNASKGRCKGVCFHKGEIYTLTPLRMEVLIAYGSKCNCCGETNTTCLDIDHATKEAYKLASRKGSGRKLSQDGLHRWLKKHHYPEDLFQILCSNCNQGKRKNYGICPHKTFAHYQTFLAPLV
jgi:hypothetical protein